MRDHVLGRDTGLTLAASMDKIMGGVVLVTMALVLALCVHPGQ